MHQCLIMELTQEQGGNRQSQVQPPLAVWEHFFGVRPAAGSLPTYRLVDALNDGDPEQRKVVKHHHNFTVEIGDAGPPRPAILRMRSIGTNSFEYWVLRERHRDFRHFQWLLRTFGAQAENGRLFDVLRVLSMETSWRASSPNLVSTESGQAQLRVGVEFRPSITYLCSTERLCGGFQIADAKSARRPPPKRSAVTSRPSLRSQRTPTSR